MKEITHDVIAQSLTYQDYRALVTQLLAKGEMTGAGVPNTPEMLEYTRLNEQRMNRLEKTFHLDEIAGALLAQIQQPMLWIVLTEGWCGDAAQILPVIQHLAQLNPNITLRMLLRDQHLDIMDAFLTNGGRSIPKVLFVEPDSGHILGDWGPRPTAAAELMADFSARMKAASDPQVHHDIYEAAKTAIHTWYAHDKTVHTQRELLQRAIGLLG